MTINEVLEALTPENARFVSGQDLFLYVPKAQTNTRYGLAKYSPNDFSIDSTGVLTLLLPKSQIEDYFAEVRGGTREETVLADPAINLLNLHLTDEDLYNEVDTLYDRDSEIYGSLGRSGTVLANIDLSKLHTRDNELQANIDYIIQDSRPSTSTDSTYSANKITQLIREAKMEGLHFVGYIGSTVGRDYNNNVIVKEGALWYQSDETTAPSNPSLWANIYKCINGSWVAQSGYTAEDFDIWKNVNIPDDEINAWWYFEGGFEVLDFNVDMSLYYTKVESDERFKSNFTYGQYLSETNKVMNIDNMNMPTSGALTNFVKGTSGLNSTNVESAIKELELYTNDNLDIINARPRWILFTDTPTRVGDYSVTTDGVYRSVLVDNQIVWRLVTNDLDDYLLRNKANVNVATALRFNSDPNTGYLTASLSLQNIDTGAISQTPISIPVATSEADGVMPATAMVAIDQLAIRMSALESGAPSYFVSFPSDSPTQAALTLLYQQVSGDPDDPSNQTMLIDVVRNMYYQYFNSTDPHWQGPYTYRYGVAASGYLGLVSSSQQDGQVYVEPATGIMSLNGYSAIINTFNTLYGGTGRTEIDVNQVPSLPASKITSGTLNSDRLPVVPISKGGTGNDTFSAYKLVVTGNIDQSTQSPSSLLDGPAFGALNTILVGQGANQLPTFKSREDAGLELVSRKVTSFVNPTDIQYPSAKLVKDSLDAINIALSTEVTARQNADNTLQSNIANNTTAISALQSVDTNLQSQIDTHGNNISDLTTRMSTAEIDINTIESKIPTQASSTNQLADKEFVNSSIQTSSASFRGSWVNWNAVPTDPNLYPADELGVKTPKTNDYMIVQDASGYPVASGTPSLTGTWRFKYVGIWSTNGKSGWEAEYQVNETSLTAAQLAAINSGITSSLVSQITLNQTNISTNATNIDTNSSNIIDLQGRMNAAEITILSLPNTYVSFATAQNLDSTQKAQARSNIGAGTSSFNGSYGNLTNKPVLDSSSITSLSTNSNETISGTIKLHKIAKTGTSTDLVDSNDLVRQTAFGSLSTRVGTAETNITTIQGKIPNEASSSNQLADKAFVNSSINALAAYYITKNANGDPFNTKSELLLATTFYSGGVQRTPTTNDYCIILSDESKTAATGVHPTTRYSYQGSQWEFQYIINDTPMTSEQLAALNSGITSTLVGKITTNESNIATNASNISTNASNITLLDIRITSVESDISDIPNNYLSYTASQVLTEEQKAIARQNIGAGNSGFSGNYPDLNQRPLLNTTNTSTLTTSNNEVINGTINLHKVSKTGKASDLVDYSNLAQAQTVTDQGIAINQINDKIPTEASSINKLADKSYVDNGISSAVTPITNLIPSAATSSNQLADKSYVDSGISTAVNPIIAKIPSAASASNQLADKDFVNSSISTSTATFRGTKNVVSDLNLTISATTTQIATALNSAITTKDANDYVYVQIPTSNSTPTQIARVDRYKYTGSSFAYEYTLNNSGYTSVQWAAINSGATSTLIGKITTNETAISTEVTNRTNADTTLQTNINTVSTNLSTETTNRTNADTALSDRINNDATPHVTSSLTLSVAGWNSSNQQTVTISGYDNTKLNTIVPDLASAIAWANAGVNATTENSNGITFTCAIKPTVALTFKVVSEKLIS